MHEISPLAWAAIALILLVAFAVNAWMVYLFKQRNNPAQSDQKPGPRRASKPAFDADAFVKAARHPFKNEQDQLKELSDEVKKLAEKKPGE